MARYIDADALIAEYDRVHIGPPGGARNLMVEAPTADVEKVKHGEWLLDGRCSECLVSPLTTHKNYCPNCGAKMDGGKAE